MAGRRRRRADAVLYRGDQGDSESNGKGRKEMSNFIRRNVPVVELLAGLAEECCELAQAALKLRRVFDGTNPTPISEEEAIEDLHEEIADVKLYCSQLDISVRHISEIMERKQKRWEDRINERGKVLQV